MGLEGDQLNKLLQDILMNHKQNTYDNGKFICFTSFMVYYLMAFCSLFTQHPWGAMDFSAGIGTIAVGFGLHFKFKKTGKIYQ